MFLHGFIQVLICLFVDDNIVYIDNLDNLIFCFLIILLY